MYKLTSAAYVDSILQDKYLWFSHIDRLNDPFECDVRRFEYSGEMYEKERDEYLNKRQLLPRLKGFVSSNHFYDRPAGPEHFPLQEVHKRVDLYHRYRDQRKRLYVLSLSETNLSPAMWAHYGDGFKGVGLKIERNTLEAALAHCSHHWKRLTVRYTRDKPTLRYSLSKDVEALVSHKHEDWSYEQELRYVLWVEPDGQQDQPGIPVSIGDSITEVHVTDNTDQSIVERIVSKLGAHRVKVITKSRLGWLEECAYA